MVKNVAPQYKIAKYMLVETMSFYKLNKETQNVKVIRKISKLV